MTPCELVLKRKCVKSVQNTVLLKDGTFSMLGMEKSGFALPLKLSLNSVKNYDNLYNLTYCHSNCYFVSISCCISANRRCCMIKKKTSLP